MAYDHSTDLPCDHTIFDRIDNTYRATKYLLELGHREIGIGFHHTVWTGDLRYRGYQRALDEFGLQSRPEWELKGGQTEDYAAAGVTMARQLLALDSRPTAMVIINDYAAIAFLSELRKSGVECPRDISIVGHDNHPLGQHNSVPLSTVTHPARQIAESTVDFLMSRLRGEYDGEARHKTISGELIARQSARQF